MSPSKLEILPVKKRRDLKKFVNLPYRLYQNDPKWIPPLKFERWLAVHPKKNPYYQHAKVQLFLATRDSRVIGRISAQIDFEYEKFHGERVGHFGFFECEDDPEAAAALLRVAEEFCRKEGAKRVLGPFSFSINQEMGFLVEGFDEPLMIMMPYNPRYYPTLVESSGYQKAKDVYAWKYFAGPILEGPSQVAEEVAKFPGLKIRNIDPKNLHRDMEIIFEVFNSAWSKNWGFVPFTPKEIKQSADETRLLLDPKITFIAEVDGNPAGICFTMPNIYDGIHDLKGRLFPFGWAKFLWRKRKQCFTSARLMMLGVKKEFRGSVLGGLSVLLYCELAREGTKRGYQFGELSWTLEYNQKINAGIEFMGGKRYKTCRIYEKKLA